MQCGKERFCWEIEGIRVRDYQTETPFSKSVTVKELVAPHEHDWACIHGGGTQIMCMIGNGRRVIGTFKDQEFVETLDRIHRQLGPMESRRILDLALNIETSRLARSVFRLQKEEPLLTDESFRLWYQTKWEYAKFQLPKVTN